MMREYVGSVTWKARVSTLQVSSLPCLLRSHHITSCARVSWHEPHQLVASSVSSAKWMWLVLLQGSLPGSKCGQGRGLGPLSLPPSAVVSPATPHGHLTTVGAPSSDWLSQLHCPRALGRRAQSCRTPLGDLPGISVPSLQQLLPDPGPSGTRCQCVHPT